MYIIYGSKNCHFCNKSTELLKNMNIQYTYFDITENKTEIMNKLASQTNNQRTVPIIFKDTNCIGGYYELMNILMFHENDDF